MKEIVVLLLLIIAINHGYCQNYSASNYLSSTNRIDNLESVLDDDGNTYVLGRFLSDIESEGITSQGSYDLFLAKFSFDQDLEWIKTISCSAWDEYGGIAISENQELYVTGSFQSNVFFTENDSLINTGILDAFLAKYDLNGNLIFKKNIAFGGSLQKSSGISIDKNQDIIIVGQFIDSVSTEGATVYSNRSSRQNYLLKLDSDGNSQSIIHYENSNSNTVFTSLRAFDDGYYLSGNLKDSLFLSFGTYTSQSGSIDMFLMKTDYNGTPIWIRKSYGNENDLTGTIDRDSYGNIIYGGYFNSDTITVDSTNSVVGSEIINKGTTDLIFYKYNKSGNLLWKKSYGAKGADFVRDIYVDNDFINITGYLADTVILGLDTLRTQSSSDKDVFIATLNTNGNVINSSIINGLEPDEEEGGKSINNYKNNLIVNGYFQSSSFQIGDSLYSNLGIQSFFTFKYELPFRVTFTEIEEISCPGQSDGQLTVTPYFGVAPYTFSWSHNGTLADSTAIGLGPGTYSVTVTDAVDSTAVVSYDLTEPDVITFNPAIINVTQCSYTEEGEIDVSVAGGNGGYQYQWLATDGGCGLALQAEDQTNLSQGTYQVTVTDSKGCTGDTTINITAPDPMTFGGTLVTDSSDLGAGAIDLIYSGGFGDPASFAFDWQGPFGFTQTTENISNLRPGNYEVTVTDVRLCEFDTLFNVANLDTFYTYIAKYKDACNGTINGTATVDFYSPDSHESITYQWDANADNQETAQATNLAPGRYYYVTVTDTENSPIIEMVDSVYIDVLPYTFEGELSGTTTLDCNGDLDGYIDLTITSQGEKPYSYNWSNGSTLQDLTNLGIGTYSVTVTDKYNCEFAITNYSIDQPTPVSAVAEIVKSPSCNGDFNGEVTVDRSGGTAPYNYQWDDPGFQDTHNADGLDAGYYNVTVSDVNGCEATSGVNLTEPAAISMSKVIDNEDCNGAGEGAIALTVNGGTTPFSYSWSTTDGSGLVLTDKNQSGLTAGKYYVTATDNNNCVYEDSAEVTEPPLLEITNETKTDVNTCNGDNTGSIEITASGGTGALTYTLNPGAIESNATGSFSGLGAGNYSVDVTDQNLCTVTSSSFTITEPTTLTLTEDDLNNVTCNGTNTGSILISVSGGTVASNYSYNWSTSDGSGISAGLQDQLALGAGTYSLTVTDDNACEITDLYTITEPAEIVITKTLYDISCHDGVDGVIVINHTGGVMPFSYYWTTDDGSGLDPVNRNQGGLSAGTYNLEITDAIGCVVNETSVITDPPAIQIDSESSTDASGEDASDGTITVEASGGTGSLTYTLRPVNKSNQTGVFSSVSPGEYTVEVIDENYCGPVASGTLTISYPNATKVDFIYSDIIKLYPNPTSSKFYVEMDYTKGITIEVLSLTGQSIVKEKIHPSGFMKKEIDISDEAKGIYLIRIYNDEISYKTKVMLQ
ncbi:MAG: T9SS type A sorting domain-containing protein [Bacteroidetes bacterium]|nr:T9SS type A sorting domain-containing protein [Bacteroidota bacterium]